MTHIAPIPSNRKAAPAGAADRHPADILAALGVRVTTLARAYGCDESYVRQMLDGRREMPSELYDWVQSLARWLDRNPIPRRETVTPRA